MRLAPRDRRALIILAVAVVLFLVIDLGVLPLIESLQEARREVQVGELTLRKYRRAAAGEGARQTSLADLQKRAATVESGMLESGTAALAVAEMQGLLKDLAAANQIELSATEFLPPKLLDANHTLVSTRFTVTANVERMVNFLTALEAAPKALAVGRLSVNAIPNSPEKRLNVTLVVSGVMRPEKPAEKGEKGKG